MSTDTDWLFRLLNNVRDAGALDDNHGGEDWTFSDEGIAGAKVIIETHESEAVKAAYDKGYNSGWVKANRLNDKPESAEYFAGQLELAAQTIRKAIKQLQDDSTGATG